ncbi:hypothetical protein QYE76_043789 [Lolium multiflorum]|uniref:Uncharacterized protein n=1 Tax=Lolium multiflorum TaxID=4521 RepID=A0AAD8TI08_LOLMU|nr:hypothetical protein QYE76_043789 [Lolium multiflorum]
MLSPLAARRPAEGNHAYGQIPENVDEKSRPVRMPIDVAEVLGVDPREVSVPVVGDHAGITIFPLMSQLLSEPCAPAMSSGGSHSLRYMGDRGDRLTPACSDGHKKNWNECLCSDTTLQSYGYSYTGHPSIYLTEVIHSGGKDLEGPYELLLLVMLGSEVIGKIFLVSTSG